MTVKEAMTKVSEDRETFPNSWNTDLKEVYEKSGCALYEKKQKRVWLLVVTKGENGGPVSISVFRSVRNAREAMERSIEAAMTEGGPGMDRSARLCRLTPCNVVLGSVRYWRITATVLND